MEAVPRMPMIWLDVKEAGEFAFTSPVRQYIHRNYGENPENYSDALRKLEKLRESVINIPRDFEGCNTLKKYFGQLHFLQSRVPMAMGQEAAVPVTWTDIFSGKDITHEDINYEQACVLYNLGALHSFLGAMDNRVSEEGMKTSCAHFQSSAGAFSYIRDHYNNNYSSDINHQTLCVNINLMLAQAQECLLEKTLLDNRKSLLIARISSQVRDYYRECVRALESSDGASSRKEWRKLIHMKISYYSALTHLHMGKQSEEQQKFGEAVAYLQRSLDRLNEAIKQGKGQPDSVQDALRFTMDVIGGKFNSVKKDNDFIYHESVPNVDALAAVKGVSLVKPVPVNPTDTGITGPDLFSKLVPMVTHEASSLYSEEKAKLLREVMAKIENKNQILDTFMDSLNCDCVDNVDTFNTLPPVLLEKCAALSVRPDAVKNLAQAMQALSSVYTDVGASLEEVCDVLRQDEAAEKTLLDALGPNAQPPPRPAALQELRSELQKLQSAHQTASSTNTELHAAMNRHIPNLRLLQGPLDQLKNSLPQLQLSQVDTTSLQEMKRLLGKVEEMRKQRVSLEKQLRELVQKDDITSVLVTTERYQIKSLFEEQLQKYDQLKGYIEQNLAAQDNILKALTDANVQNAAARKKLMVTQQQWNSSVESLVASYEAYENLVKKAEEGRSFYEDMDKKTASLLERVKTLGQSGEQERVALMEREVGYQPPPRPTARKPALGTTASAPSIQQSLPPDVTLPRASHIPANLPPSGGGVPPSWPPGAAPSVPTPLPNQRLPQMAPLPQPGAGYVFPAPPRGVASAPAPVNPHMGHMPPPWHQAPLSVPAQQVGGPQSFARPGFQVPQIPIPGGHLPSPAGQPALPASSQQIPPGSQYQGFPPQPGPGGPYPMPRVAFPGQNQPPVNPGQFQSSQMPAQMGQASGYWPSLAPQTQYPVPVPGSQPQRAPFPGQGPGQVHARPPNQAQPPANVGPFHSSPQMPGPFQNPSNQAQVPQAAPGMPFGQGAPMPFGYQAAGPAPQQGNAYFQPGAPSTQPQFPVTQHGIAPQQPPFQPGSQLQNQTLPPQNIPPSSSGPRPASVMDDPNPPAASGVLTPSPAQNPQFLPDKMSNLSLSSQGGGERR